MVYGYARVSTRKQDTNGNSLEAQKKALKEAGAKKFYKDTITGTKADRPQLNELLEVLKEGDTLIVTKLDRVARSTAQGSELIRELLEKGVTVNILNLGVLDNSSIGKLMVTVLFAIAEFERDMIVERTQEGREIARQKPGYKDGRKKKFTDAQLEAALEHLESNSYTQTVKAFGISKSTLIREKEKRGLL